MHMENQKEIYIVIKTRQTEVGSETTESQLAVNAVEGESEGVKLLIYNIENSLNVLMIYKDYAKMVKSGEATAEMLFVENKETSAVFSIAGQKLTFDVYTKKCKTYDNDKFLELEYTLSAQGQLISEYELSISKYIKD